MRHKRRRLQRQRKKTWLAILAAEEIRAAMKRLIAAIQQTKVVL